MNKNIEYSIVFVLVICLGSNIGYSQTSPERISKNKINKANYFETRVDSDGVYRYNNALKGVVTYNRSGNDVLFELLNYKDGKTAVLRRYFVYDSIQNEIESFQISENYDATFSDTNRRNTLDYEDERIIRKTHYPTGLKKCSLKTITSYHYLRDGYYFTYTRSRKHFNNERAGFDIERKEYRSGNGRDTIISILYNVIPKKVNHRPEYDTVLLSRPDTSITRFDSTNLEKEISLLTREYGFETIKFSSVKLASRISTNDTYKLVMKFYNEWNQEVIEVKYGKGNLVRKVTKIQYDSNALYIGSETIYYPSLAKWTRRVEYVKF
jgi:hypothetical protein